MALIDHSRLSCNMVKPLLLVALLAKAILLVSSTGVARSSRSSSAGSSSSSSTSETVVKTRSSASAAQFAHQQQSSPRYSPAPVFPSEPRQPYCRVNEIWSNCPIAVCAPKTCGDVGFSVACADLRPDGQCPVKPGCICKENYVRNSKGICIHMTYCPSCGGDRNAISGCGYNCNRLCSNYDKKPGACPQSCLYNSCECRRGFVYDEMTGECVFPSQCSRMICNKKNEEYDPCPAPCPFRTCGIDDAAISCTPPLCPGDPNCPPPTCRCSNGYYRNDVGECVLWDQCPVCKSLNEMYDPCPAPCPPQTCDVNIALILCVTPPKLGDPECKPGCRCIDDHVRNRTGVCIPRDQCPTCSNPNEMYDSCIAPCPPRRCDVDDRSIRCAAPPKLGDKDCKAGCRCVDGYYKNKMGVCVTRDECPPICKGMYEVYSECIQGDCNPKNCSELGFPISCPRIDPKYCEKGCLCTDGYMRDKHGVCIPKEQCPSCGGDCNAVAGCGNCIKRCADIGKEPVFCTEICYNNACDCKEGFYYDDNAKKCVTAEQCTPTCKADEIYSDCMEESCRAQNCSQLGFPIACPIFDSTNTSKCCTKGCLCKDNYVRNKDGVCIPSEECPSCGGDPNAVSGCGVNCGRLCSNYFKKGVVCPLICQINGCDCRKDHVYDSNTKKCVLPKECTPVCNDDEVYSDCFNKPCPVQNCSLVNITVDCLAIDPKHCIKGCLCKAPYMREDDGSCVPIANCKPPVCKANEVYSKCINGGCTAKNCSQVGLSIPCVKIDPKYCIKGCLCQEGYLREVNGECVPVKECKPRCNKPNEYYEACDYDCPPNTCESLNRTYDCPIQDGHNCKGKCKCMKGYYRNTKGDCITKKQCQMCMGPHEYFACGGACDNYCDTLQEQNQTNCLIFNIKCNEKCYCEKNYARAKNGTCIPIKDCDKCKKNEHYEKCPAWLCEPKECSELGYPIPCPFIPADSKCPVKPDCVCDDGYLRNCKGKCIPKGDCPTCGGDPNAESGCGNNCGRLCSNYFKKGVVCTLECQLNGCDCRKGYVHDTPVCKANEVYSECINGGCTAKNCSQVGLPIPCVKIDPKYCIKGCLCQEGYLREDNGECVLAEDCKPVCRGKHEVYEDCTNPSCRPKTCSEVGFDLNCTDPIKCNKGCICEDGYVRSPKGKCVPIKKCPSCGGDKNAQSGCGVNCLKKCYDIQHPNRPRPCPKICKVNSCDCKKDYYYDESTGKCVKSFECSPNCAQDEVVDPCSNGGCTIKNCSQINEPMCDTDPKNCKPGCSCKNGSLRSDNGTCIAFDKCPEAKCGTHEVFNLCPDTFCGVQRCNQLGFPYKCLIMDDDCCPGPPGCICENNYVRDDDGNCIPKRECPSCGGDPNAWSGCGLNCIKNCDTLNGQKKICPRICIQNSCDCKDGFYYDKNLGKCVTAENCTRACGDNEVYNSCINGGCGPKNCSQVNGPILCIDPMKCKGGCLCKKDYLRLDDTGVCVPKEKCPQICNKPNEVYVKCPPICPPQTCESINKTYHCPLIKTVVQNCTGKCRCDDGYYRNLNNECISKEDCSICTGPHEYYSCGPSCDNVCKDLDTQNKTNCLIKNKKCVSKCYCEDGYARNGSDVCVAIKDCPATVNTTVALANFEIANTRLCIAFIRDLLDAREGENFMVSALSLLLALAQLAISSINAAREQLLQLFNLQTNDEILTVCPIKLENLKEVQGVILEIYNKYYANEEKYPVSDKFIHDANTLGSEAENVDFSQNVQLAADINEWVSNRTKGLIPDLVSPDMFGPLTRLAIFNVMYFLGNWKYPFDEKKTESKDFYLNNKDTVSLPTMQQRNTFEYGESKELDAQMIVLPYKGDECELVICLPNEKTGLVDLMDKLDPEALATFRKALSKRKCDVYIPRMNIIFDFSDLKTVLMELNITAPFDPNSDNFEGVLKNYENLAITDIIQKTVFKVNELGTEAAAATGGIVGTTAVQNPVPIAVFEWNRPGVFFLSCSNTLLFSGAFVGGQ